MSVICGHQQGYQQEGTFCSTWRWISPVGTGRKFTLHTDGGSEKICSPYIYSSWVIPWTSQELVHIWCISMISIFHNGWNFKGKTEAKHLNMQFKSHLRNASCPCRTCLLLWVVQAMGGSFLLEQPRSSLLLWQPRMREFMKSLPKVAYGKNHPLKTTKSIIMV